MAKKDIKAPVSVFTRPPVVAVVGHIDHGKTSLLDKIRESKIQAREAGGITQHIGASQVIVKTKEGKEREITFIDTPGHAAFTKMRARGVEVTDLVILVVAADSGVQEQTKESLNHIKAAKMPFIIAINKTDLPTADVEKTKGQLTEISVVPEDYGGDVTVVPVSAKTGQGIDDLLEMVLLLADLQELKAKVDGNLEGVVIESALDRNRGAVATVLVKNGTLRLGEEIYAESTRAKVKAMRNWLGEAVKEVLPGNAAEVLGFEEVPLIGAMVSSTPGKKVEKKEEKADKDDEEIAIKLVIKADVQGSLEALLANLPEKTKVIHSGVGEVTDSDVFLAQTTGGEIFGFNIKVSPPGKKIAEQSGVDIFQAKIIYEILEEIEKRIEKKINPFSGKEVLGKAEIIAEFKIKKKRIAGCRVVEGKIIRGEKASLMRDKEIVGETVVSSMRHVKEDIDKAEKGTEFGAVFSPQLDFKIGDVIISHNDAESDKSDQGSRAVQED